MLDFLLKELGKLCVLVAALFGALAWFYPSFPRWLRITTKKQMKKTKHPVRKAFAWAIGLGGLTWICLTLYTDWEKYKAEHESEAAKVKRAARILADQLEPFGQECRTNYNGPPKGPRYFQEQYANAFRDRVHQVVRDLGRQGKYSPDVDISHEFPTGLIILTNAAEIRRLASELKD